MLLIAGFIFQKLKLSVITDKASGSSCIDGLTPSMRLGSLSLLFARVFCKPTSVKRSAKRMGGLLCLGSAAKVHARIRH